MWHYAIVLIEKPVTFTSLYTSKGWTEEVTNQQTCYVIVALFPCKPDSGITTEDYRAHHGAQVWIEQNGLKNHKYAIVKMFIQDGTN